MALFRLTNFPAKITAELLVSDGVDAHREFEIEAIIAGCAQTATVKAEEYAWMNWVLPAFGPRAIITAGFDVKDHVRAAIQYLSHNIPTINVYTHLGWVTVEGKLQFLLSNGALGNGSGTTGIPNGPMQDHRNDPTPNGLAVEGPKGPKIPQLMRNGQARVRVPDSLSLFQLPNPPSGALLNEAIQRSLGMLSIAPDRFIFPLYAAIWRATLGDVNYSNFVVGKTGSGKSESAALAQQHYGAGMDRHHLPTNWLSTANANEGTAFLAKDVLLVIDDFVLQGSRGDIEKAHRDADRVLRAQSNNSGRARCNRDGTPKGQKPPRCMLLLTGEDVPDGQSLNARVLVLELHAKDMNWEQLTICQKNARPLPVALSPIRQESRAAAKSVSEKPAGLDRF